MMKDVLGKKLIQDFDDQEARLNEIYNAKKIKKISFPNVIFARKESDFVKKMVSKNAKVPYESSHIKINADDSELSLNHGKFFRQLKEDNMEKDACCNLNPAFAPVQKKPEEKTQ